jgi:hypothetical protein
MGKWYARGLQRRVIYYSNFGYAIRAGIELWNVHFKDFRLCKDEFGPYVCYNERLFKNYKVDMTHFQEEHFKAPLKNYEEDVIDTFKSYLSQHPRCKKLFLQPIDNPAKTDKWYKTGQNVSKASLTNTLKGILQELGINATEYGNKSGRASMVTRISHCGVPPEIGKLVTGIYKELRFYLSSLDGGCFALD